MRFGRTTWWIYACGALAAAQLGKAPVLVPAIAADLGLGFVAGALVVSLIEIGGALFGAVAAAGATRLGHRATLNAALAALAAGSLGGALAPDAWTLILARAVEAAGYLGVIVSAPVLMAASTPERDRGAALMLWSTFVPVGVAVSAVLSGLGVETIGWRGTLALWAAAALAVLALGRAAAPPAPAMARARARAPGRRAVVAALGFGCFTCCQVGVLALTPAHLAGVRGLSLQGAGLLTGLGAVSTVVGAFAPLALARAPRAGASSRVWSGAVIAAALLVPVAAVAVQFSGAVGVAGATAAFVVVNVGAGVFAALVFAGLPRLAADGDITAANGAIAQCGALGSLIGPPLFAWGVEAAGWGAAGALAGVTSLGALALTLAARRDDKGRAPRP